jgi:hypothetical protein
MGTPKYETLSGPERFALMIEAMARKDEAECDRLEDSCPKRVYRCDDTDFRYRMRRAYHITAAVCLNMRAGLARIRMAQTFLELREHFAGPTALVARVVFLYGRAHARWELGACESVGLPDAQALAAEVRANPDLKNQLAEMREVAGEATRKVAETLHAAVGEADAVDLLSQWEGFGRFCRERLDASAVTAVAAFVSGPGDAAADLAAAFPGTRYDEAQAARWAAEWSRG